MFLIGVEKTLDGKQKLSKGQLFSFQDFVKDTCKRIESKLNHNIVRVAQSEPCTLSLLNFNLAFCTSYSKISF